MKTNFAAVLTDAWTLFRRDADLLLRIGGPFLFFPAFALTLLVPAMPMPDPNIADRQAQVQAWGDAASVWIGDYGIGMAVAYAVTYFGIASIMALYCDRTRPDVGGALSRIATLFPRFVLAMIVISIPAGLGMFFFVVPGLYVIGRTLLAAPVLIAERPIGAVRSIGRSLTLTQGNGLTMMGLAAFVYLIGFLGGQPFMLIDGWMRRGGAPNPVAVAVVDAAAAGVAMLAQVALALIAVSAYRRLAR